MRIHLIVIFFISSISSVFSQGNVEKIEEKKFDEVLDFFISINFSDEIKPKNSAFYYDDFGHYYIKATNFIDQESFINNLTSEVRRFSAYELLSEKLISNFDLSQLKKEILLNCDVNHVNAINYNRETDTLQLKVYKMIEKGD